MNVKRQTEVRLASWLCEAIEDTINRFHTVIKSAEQDVAGDEKRANEEREKQNDPLLGKYANPEMYEGFVEQYKRDIAIWKAGIDELLDLLKSAQELKRRCIEFWEKLEKKE